MRTIKLIARFYRGIFLPNFFVTIVSVYAIASHRDQANKLIGTFFWGKIITVALIIYFAFTAKKKGIVLLSKSWGVEAKTSFDDRIV